MVAPDEQDQQDEDECDRQKRNVALEKANDRPRPSRGSYALHGDEHHTGGRDRCEVEPVDEQRLPHPVRLHEQTDQEDNKPEHRAGDGYGLEERRRWPIEPSYDLFSCRNVCVVPSHRITVPRALSAFAFALAESSRTLASRRSELSGTFAALSAAVSDSTSRGLKKGAGTVGPIRVGPGTLSPVTPGGASGPTST